MFITSLLVEKLLHIWVLLHFLEYGSWPKVTTFLFVQHFWIFTTYLGLTTVIRTKYEATCNGRNTRTRRLKQYV